MKRSDRLLNITETEVTANRHEAIRGTLTRLGMHATPTQVVDELESLGVEVSEAIVLRVKEQMRREESKALRERAKRLPKTKRHQRPQQRKIPPRRG